MATPPRQIPNPNKVERTYGELVSPFVAESETGLHYQLNHTRDSVREQPKVKPPVTPR